MWDVWMIFLDVLDDFWADFRWFRDVLDDFGSIWVTTTQFEVDGC